MGFKITIEAFCDTQEDVALVQKAVIGVASALPKDKRELLEKDKERHTLYNSILGRPTVPAPAPKAPLESGDASDAAPAKPAKAAKAPAKAAKKEAAPAPKKDDDGRPTIVAVRKALAALAEHEGGYEKAKEILAKYDAKDIPTLAEESYGNVVEDVESAIAEIEQGSASEGDSMFG